MEKAAIRLIAFMCHNHPACQDKVRELNGLVTVLQRCQLDDNNPQIREWGIVAIRNLTEGNQDNQAFIASIEQQPQAVANKDLLSGAGLELGVDRATGKVRIVRKDGEAAEGAAAAIPEARDEAEQEELERAFGNPLA